MTVTIDCRHLGSSGIGVYLQGCLPYFLNTDNYFNLIGDSAKLEPLVSNCKNACILDCHIKPFSLQELFLFPFLSKINKSDLYFSPFFNIPQGIKVPVYTTIHDIVFPDMPGLVSGIGLSVRMWFYRRALKKSRKMFTVSEFSKSRIRHHLGTTKPIIVTHSAIQPMFIEYGANNHNVQKKQTIVFVGNIKKHKGLESLLDAFLSAKNEGLPHKLIIIGSEENFRSSDNAVLNKINSAGTDAVSFTGFISDEQLMAHLAEASLLVQPSLYEGFGLPPLEAMVLGTYALISDIPVFREIYADYPVAFFRAGDTADLKDKLLEMLRRKNLEPLVLTKELSLRYTFEKTANVILREWEA